MQGHIPLLRLCGAGRRLALPLQSVPGPADLAGMSGSLETSDQNRLRLLAIVPAYNEEGMVGRVVREIERVAPEFDVVVVDDGSVDTTVAVAEEAGAVVLRHPFNLGIGGAMQSGYKYALANDYDVAVQVDGDGQHKPAYLPEMVAALHTSENEADMVYGTFAASGPLFWVVFVLAAAVAGQALFRIADEYRDRFVITNQRVFRVHGTFSTQRASVPLGRILDITVNKPLLGRFLNYGHFVFESAAQVQGISEITFVADIDARDAVLQETMQRAGLRATAPQLEDGT